MEIVIKKNIKNSIILSIETTKGYIKLTFTKGKDNIIASSKIKKSPYTFEDDKLIIGSTIIELNEKFVAILNKKIVSSYYKIPSNVDYRTELYNILTVENTISIETIPKKTNLFSHIISFLYDQNHLHLYQSSW